MADEEWDRCRLARGAAACFPPGVTQDRPPKQPPNLGAEAEAARLARLAREAAALRQNLRRRKAQTRARDSEGEPAADSPEGKDNVES